MDKEEKMSPRERRAQHAKTVRLKAIPKAAALGLVKPAIAVGVLALLGVGVYYATNVNTDCPGHWHGTFGVFEPDATGAPREVNFRSPALEMGRGLPMSSHMHQADGKNQFHFEPPQNQCVSLGKAMSAVGVSMDSDSMKVSGVHDTMGDAGQWQSSGNQTLRGFVQSSNGTWSERNLPDLLKYQLRDGESALFAFGNYTSPQISEMQKAVPPPTSRR